MGHGTGVSISHPKRRAARGTLLVFLAESLMFPTGLVTVAYLTRHLGPTDYGLFALAGAIVAWVEWTVGSLFARATLKFVGEAEDWRPVGGAVARLSLVSGVAAAALLVAVSGPLSRALHQPPLAGYLVLFAVDVPLFCLAQAHRNILVGIGSYGRRASASAGRWVTRLVLVIVLVHLGLSVEGAILGCVLASAAELAIARFYIRPRLLRPGTFPVRCLFDYALPTFLFAAAMRLYEKVDLISLTAMTGSPEQAGVYGAAQNLALVPGIFAMSFSPLLLSTIARQLSAGQREAASAMAADAMRVVLLMLPIAAITAGAATEVTVLCFGPMYRESGPILARLIFAAVGVAMISVTTAVLTAGGRPVLALVLTAPMVPTAVAGHWLIIPAHGARGAAGVQAAVAWVGAAATIAAVRVGWGVLPRASTVLRAIAVAGAAGFAAASWPTAGAWLVVKLCVLTLAVVGGLALLGEFSAAELAWARSAVGRRMTRRRRPVNEVA